MPLKHWLILSITDGIGPVIARRLIERAGSVEAACEADANLLRTVEGVGATKSNSIARSLAESRTKADDVIAKAHAKPGMGLICPDDENFPHLLHSAIDAPLALFYRGTLEPRDLNAIAIVGSRKCSFYGREQAERFARLLAGAGFTVISGGARGVDSAAHKGAIEGKHGRTIAVLGSGLDVPYPPENIGLFEQIAESGCLISEFPLGTPPKAENFPRRNRIVSGMSRGVLVIEADERSGALITARQAIEDHQRPVMCLPGRCDNPQSAGPHKLIREGATLVTRLEHILEALGPLDASLPEMPIYERPNEAELFDALPPAPKPVSTLSATQTSIRDALTRDPADVDTLVERSGLEAHVVTRELTFLQLKGLAKRVDGQKFVRAV